MDLEHICEFCSVLLLPPTAADNRWICPECGTEVKDKKNKGIVMQPLNEQPWIHVINDGADADARRNTNIVTSGKVIPDDPEGPIENRLGTDMARRAGVQKFHEETHFPNSNKTVITDINLTDSAGKNRTVVRRT